jgi:hypothetical protein
VTYPNTAKLRKFERTSQARLAVDIDGNLAYLVAAATIEACSLPAGL